MFWLLDPVFLVVAAVNLVVVAPLALYCYFQDRRHPPDPSDPDRIYIPD